MSDRCRSQRPALHCSPEISAVAIFAINFCDGSDPSPERCYFSPGDANSIGDEEPLKANGSVPSSGASDLEKWAGVLHGTPISPYEKLLSTATPLPDAEAPWLCCSGLWSWSPCRTEQRQATLGSCTDRGHEAGARAQLPPATEVPLCLALTRLALQVQQSPRSSAPGPHLRVVRPQGRTQPNSAFHPQRSSRPPAGSPLHPSSLPPLPEPGPLSLLPR